ncbi:carbohydrate kinase family protein [Candidatus Woesearchaeota archaeon]|nr:carbohydrate kinase family protein [Candidatus Woesearchaeota archaeon]
MYPVGEKILVNHLEHQIGGGGTNTAVSFSRLGLRTGYVGVIGKDDEGLKVFRLLKKENVHFLGVLGKVTGLSVVLDSLHDDRTILTYKGCNDSLRFKDIVKANLKTKWFYFSSMVGESFDALNDLALFAESARIKVVFNPSSYLVKKGAAYLNNILSRCHCLILNKDEARVLSGKKDIKSILKFLKTHVKDLVVVTDGKNGAWCYDGDLVLQSKSSNKLKIVETTGAGDAFASGFTSGLVLGKNLKAAFKMGFIQAESVIQSYGAKNKLLNYDELVKLLNKDNRKIVEYKLR